MIVALAAAVVILVRIVVGWCIGLIMGVTWWTLGGSRACIEVAIPHIILYVL